MVGTEAEPGGCQVVAALEQAVAATAVAEEVALEAAAWEEVAWAAAAWAAAVSAAAASAVVATEEAERVAVAAAEAVTAGSAPLAGSRMRPPRRRSQSFRSASRTCSAHQATGS